jgi:hypothetical protein
LSKKRSKAAERQRIKERWFDVGTAAFERVFPGARAKRFPEIENPYICPLCEHPFGRAAVADGTLTFEDAPPKSYGGKPVALSCKGCNNSLGSSLDAPLSAFDSNGMSPCRLGINGVEVVAFQEIRPDGRFSQYRKTRTTRVTTRSSSRASTRRRSSRLVNSRTESTC